MLSPCLEKKKKKCFGFCILEFSLENSCSVAKKSVSQLHPGLQIHFRSPLPQYKLNKVFFPELCKYCDCWVLPQAHPPVQSQSVTMGSTIIFCHPENRRKEFCK